ncbi:unnamed protein product [Linum tenue]|nr:unnamed protein product [Linum tenue]
MVMKLALKTGLVPNFNICAALVGFVFVKTWTMLLAKTRFVSKPFIKQENTLIQTCVVACYSLAFAC